MIKRALFIFIVSTFIVSGLIVITSANWNEENQEEKVDSGTTTTTTTKPIYQNDEETTSTTTTTTTSKNPTTSKTTKKTTTSVKSSPTTTIPTTTIPTTNETTTTTASRKEGASTFEVRNMNGDNLVINKINNYEYTVTGDIAYKDQSSGLYVVFLRIIASIPYNDTILQSRSYTINTRVYTPDNNIRPFTLDGTRNESPYTNVQGIALDQTKNHEVFTFKINWGNGFESNKEYIINIKITNFI